LLRTQRSDGAWPIDTNLATWTTTLATLAVQSASRFVGASPEVNLDWILRCQNQVPHPFTGAAPGGWGWSDLSGAVPDADDTPGALLALKTLEPRWRDSHNADRIKRQIEMGIRWLVDLQNRNGGWPTFCRGWGKLPFDRSGADLTAHALRALHVWRGYGSSRVERAIARGLSYLERQQRPDGSWLPLWFGNQDQTDDENPVYGTTKVLSAYRDLAQLECSAAQRGAQWLLARQNSDGGWGGELRFAGARTGNQHR
jgi:squalene-hopene/tetraprenyl-beta-curcumene cyclase